MARVKNLARASVWRIPAKKKKKKEKPWHVLAPESHPDPLLEPTTHASFMGSSFFALYAAPFRASFLIAIRSRGQCCITELDDSALDSTRTTRTSANVCHALVLGKAFHFVFRGSQPYLCKRNRSQTTTTTTTTTKSFYTNLIYRIRSFTFRW